MRWLKRWWARVTHKHEWVVIWRGVVDVLRVIDRKKWQENCILERCTCGEERARQWLRTGGWKSVDLDWLNDQLARQDIDIPARHQE